jgi:hypothetical protein
MPVIARAIRTCLYEEPAARYGADTDDVRDGQDGGSAWAVVAQRASCGGSSRRGTCALTTRLTSPAHPRPYHRDEAKHRGNRMNQPYRLTQEDKRPKGS